MMRGPQRPSLTGTGEDNALFRYSLPGLACAFYEFYRHTEIPWAQLSFPQQVEVSLMIMAEAAGA
jgi:hypothetical protein